MATTVAQPNHFSCCAFDGVAQPVPRHESTSTTNGKSEAGHRDDRGRIPVAEARSDVGTDAERVVDVREHVERPGAQQEDRDDARTGA